MTRLVSRYKLKPIIIKRFIPLIMAGILVGMYIPFTADALIEPTPLIVEQEVVWEKRVILIGTEITWTPERIEEEIRTVFWEEPDLAVAIAKCESQLNPNAINTANKNGTVDRGLMQLNSVHDLSGIDVWDVQDNLAFARKLYNSEGFIPWVCFTKKLYVL